MNLVAIAPSGRQAKDTQLVLHGCSARLRHWGGRSVIEGMQLHNSCREIPGFNRRAKSSFKANGERRGQAPRGAAKSVSSMGKTPSQVESVTLPSKMENPGSTPGRRVI